MITLGLATFLHEERQTGNVSAPTCCRHGDGVTCGGVYDYGRYWYGCCGCHGTYPKAYWERGVQ